MDHEKPKHLTPVPSNRGFDHYPPIDTDYGALVRVYESSAAEAPHCWLSIEEPDDLNHPNMEETHTATAHCSLEQAKMIRDQLDATE